MRTAQGIFIDDSQLSQYQQYGWRTPFGAPIAPTTPNAATWKYPTDVQAWMFDWGNEWLTPGETLVSSLWLADGLVLTGELIDVTNTKTAVLIGGGIGGQSYEVTNRVTSSLTPPRRQDWIVTVDVIAD